MFQLSGGSSKDIRKKNYVAAAMSVEFVSYYLSKFPARALFHMIVVTITNRFRPLQSMWCRRS